MAQRSCLFYITIIESLQKKTNRKLVKLFFLWKNHARYTSFFFLNEDESRS